MIISNSSFTGWAQKVAGFLQLGGLVVLLMLAFQFRAAAQGNLLLSPRRIVFEGSKRTQELNLANTGSDTARYLISMIEIHMNEDGSFTQLSETDSNKRFASQFVRFFPRSVVLGPNEAQTVKVQIIRAGELEPGEYRSHMYFRAAPDPNAGANESGSNDSNLTVTIKPMFGISIPVIIRSGENATSISLSDMSFADNGEPAANVVLKRNGNMSTYGNLTVEHISESGTATQVGIARGLAVYTCVDRRLFRLPLEKSAVDYKKGSLRFTYTEDDAKGAVIAEGMLKLNN